MTAGTAGGILVNGAPRALGADRSLAGLLRELGLRGKRVAVERNGGIVPRSAYDTVELVAGDRLEIVVAVGGG